MRVVLVVVLLNDGLTSCWCESGYAFSSKHTSNFDLFLDYGKLFDAFM